MASFIFKRQPSPTRTQRYSVEFSREGRGLGRKQQLSADQVMCPKPGKPRNFPKGTDTKAPLLPHEGS